jgi:cytochrome P450
MQTSSRDVEEPAHVRAAPAHADPYPYYARLAREQPVFRDERSNCWVVASAAAVREVLESESCLTRPVVGRVPVRLGDGPTADLFTRLVRLNDGEAHAAMKGAVLTAMRRLDLDHVAELARVRAAELHDELGPEIDEDWVTTFMFALPVQVLARLLGVPDSQLAGVVASLGDYGPAVAAAATGVPEPTPELIARGDRAAAALVALVRELAHDSAAQGPLLEDLLDAGREAGCDEESVVANGVGLLIQGFAAVASLVGLTLLALANDPQLREEVDSDRALLPEVVQEVVRFDPSTNSTIRFVARDEVIAGEQMREGDTIIVLIGAANRDPELNADPDAFDIQRTNRRYLEFGAGRHACPANRLAPLLAEIAVDCLLDWGAPIDRLPAAVTYAPSAHIRTPLFAKEKPLGS